jgi:hypothetical protein
VAVSFRLHLDLNSLIDTVRVAEKTFRKREPDDERVIHVR